MPFTSPLAPLAAALALAALATPGAASAQQAGVYAGTTSAGGQVEVYIDDDGAGGLLLGLVGHQFRARCANGDRHPAFWYIAPYPYGSVPVTGPEVAAEMAAPIVFTRVRITFSADGQSMTGQISSGIPALDDARPYAAPSQGCFSGGLRFEASYVPPAERTTARPVPDPRRGAIEVTPR